jgi:hypothetical protein
VRGPRLAGARSPIAHAVFVVRLPHFPLGLLQLAAVDRVVYPAVSGGLVAAAAAAQQQPRQTEEQRREGDEEGGQTSRFLTNLAFSSMNLRRGSTSSPIRVSNRVEASSASSIVTLSSVRLGGSMVVSRS